MEDTGSRKDSSQQGQVTCLCRAWLPVEGGDVGVKEQGQPLQDLVHLWDAQRRL